MHALVQQVSALAAVVNIAATIARLERRRLEELWRGCIARQECIPGVMGPIAHAD